MSTVDATTTGECRHLIGVWGDRSCGELEQYTHCRNCPVYARLGRTLLRRTPDKDYLEEWRTRLAMPPAAAVGNCSWVLLFRVRGEWMALPVSLVREVINPQRAHRVPHRSNPALRGIVGVHGEHVPCFDIGHMVRAAENASGRALPRILVLERHGEAWAIDVDEVSGVWRLPDSDVRPPPATVETGVPCFTGGIFTANGREVALLDEDLVVRGCAEACR